MKKSNVTSIRKERNLDLIRRMKNGDALTNYDSAASWFPPRPIIEKDKNEMARLYGTSSKKHSHRIDEENESPLSLLPRAQ